MSSHNENSYSLINITTDSSSESSPNNSHTGFTPDSKRAKKGWFIRSPSIKEKIDDICHYQRESLQVHREIHYGQQSHDKRLSFWEQCAAKFCGTISTNKDVIIRTPPSRQNPPNPWEQGTSRFSPVKNNRWSPNSWEKGTTMNSPTKVNIWSPLKPLKERTKDELEFSDNSKESSN